MRHFFLIAMLSLTIILSVTVLGVILAFMAVRQYSAQEQEREVIELTPEGPVLPVE